ncbi:hypothetical protein SSX86_015528 [Deinandra increscens subsp. villosa]|uniref:Retrotransposon gag domain-containing protein n=1 Tax=Deinandra increscens subsp. villosa TaxID=3103831 RepID=A0AAP0D1L6_9ASTR
MSMGDSNPDGLTLQIAEILKSSLPNIQQLSNSEKVTLSIKLNGENYPLWARLMKVEIEPNLIGKFAEYQSAKSLWDALAVTYGSGEDALQIYDLHNQVSRQNQGTQTLEQYWNTLQGIWLAIDRRRPNPMKSDEDISMYNKLTQETRLFNLLGGLYSRYDVTRREILRMEPLPSPELAYATIRKEATRVRILQSETNNEGDSTGGIGSGLLTRNLGEKSFGSSQKGRLDKSSKPWVDKSKLQCTHCGMSKHTKETCFKLVGFPDWWEDGHKPEKPLRGRHLLPQEITKQQRMKTTAVKQKVEAMVNKELQQIFLHRRSLGVALSEDGSTLLMRWFNTGLLGFLTGRSIGKSGYGTVDWVIHLLGILKCYFLLYFQKIIICYLVRPAF